MELVVVSHLGIILNETADRITLPGSMGAFSVLKNHAPLISTLEKGEIVYLKGKTTKKYPIEGGVTIVEKNKIRVIID